MITDVGSGVLREWLVEGSVCSYTISSASRASADAWLADCQGLLDAIPANHTLHWLFDLSQTVVALTPYTASTARRLASYRHDIRGDFAVVVRHNLLGELFRIFASGLPLRGQVRVFFSRDEALAWIMNRPTSQGVRPPQPPRFPTQ